MKNYKAPGPALDSARTHELVLETSCGEIVIALDVDRAPKTASSVAFLAGDGFYDGLKFHRIVKGFVIQGGDPEGTGRGGPGYTVVEAPPKDLKYDPGVVAMAKRADEAAGSSGSQFFICSGSQASSLPPEYALVGKVSDGMGVVALIERLGSSGDTITIDRAHIREAGGMGE